MGSADFLRVATAGREKTFVDVWCFNGTGSDGKDMFMVGSGAGAGVRAAAAFEQVPCFIGRQDVHGTFAFTHEHP